MNFTNITKIKNRLHTIIDSILIQYNNTQANIYGLDQTKLQEWCDLLKLTIINKQNMKQIININDKQIKQKNKKDVVKFIDLPRIKSTNGQKKQLMNNKQQHSSTLNMKSQFTTNKILQVVNNKKLILHQFNTVNNKNKKQLSQKNQYQFASDTFHRFCSIVQIQTNKFIIAGGCKYSNPLQKTNNISIFQCKIGQYRKIGQLLQPISSHASIFINPYIYFIGGKKNQGIITKMCSCYNIVTKQINQIAALNYNTASTCLVQWQNKYIYKIGGIGECFNQFNLSPYIERYTIQQDIWDVINPYIPPNIIDRFHDFQLYAHSIAYISKKNQIVILGGFDFDKKNVNFGCVIQIKTNSAENKFQNQYEYQQQQQLRLESNNQQFTYEENQIHQIKYFGPINNLQNGGFWTSQLVIQEEYQGKQNIYALLTSTNPTLKTKIIKLTTK